MTKFYSPIRGQLHLTDTIELNHKLNLQEIYLKQQAQAIMHRKQ